MNRDMPMDVRTLVASTYEINGSRWRFKQVPIVGEVSNRRIT